MKETWKDIDGYEGIYQISTMGRVKRLVGYSCKRERILKPCPNGRGYLHVGVLKNGKRKNLRIHRSVAVIFIPNPENKPQVNHIDGVKTNNRIDNLEWNTASENIIHAHANGLCNKKKTSANWSTEVM
jgi:hypothetical protein